MSLIEPTIKSSRGLQETGAPTVQVVPVPSMRRARDGSVLWWGDADTPGPPPVISPGVAAPVTVAVSPVRPGHAVTVEYRVNGGPVRQAIGQPEPRVHDLNARDISGGPAGAIRRAGRVPAGASLRRPADLPRSRGVGRVSAVSGGQRSGRESRPRNSSATSSAELAGEPLWDWGTRFLWSATITIRKEVVGELPDGLRINWYLVEGSFAGPSHDGIVLPGAADAMRIRKDGIGIVDVTELLQTRRGARLYCSYGGIFDLGVDGYARALRGEFDPLPAFVVTPTYTTADKELAWLNRTQCIGVGRVDMKALRLEYDVYAVGVGGANMPRVSARRGGRPTENRTFSLFN